MSHTPSANDPCSHFQSILDLAVEEYKKKTGKDLTSHPLLARLIPCQSPDSILSVLREQIPAFDQPGSNNDWLTNWLDPIVNVLCTFSATIGAGVSLVSLRSSRYCNLFQIGALMSILQAFHPASVVFTGIGVLLSVSVFLDSCARATVTQISQTVKAVRASKTVLVDIFERIENFFKRLETYTEVTPTAAMTDITVKIMAEVLSILAIATKEIEQNFAGELVPGDRRSLVTYSFSVRFGRRLAGRTDIDDGLRRLDKLTQDQVRMVVAQVLKTTQEVDNIVTDVDIEVQGVSDKLQEVDDRLKGVDEKVDSVLDGAQVALNSSLMLP
jgi:hypothetical protein